MLVLELEKERIGGTGPQDHIGTIAELAIANAHVILLVGPIDDMAVLDLPPEGGSRVACPQNDV